MKNGRLLHKFVRQTILPAILITLLTVPSVRAADTVCITCHGAQAGRLGQPVKQWQTSIHAENGISCHDCHGGAPKDAANAMSPARGFIGKPREIDIPGFCGRCHVGIKDDYLLSAHGKALGKGGPACVTCHGDHGVKKASIDIINEKTCTQCHSFERAALIKSAMIQTETTISSMDKNLKILKGQGIDTEAQEKHLFSIRNSYRRLFHEINTAKVTKESAVIRNELKRIDGFLEQNAIQQKKRKIIGVVIVGGLLLTALVMYRLKKAYD